MIARHFTNFSGWVALLESSHATPTSVQSGNRKACDIAAGAAAGLAGVKGDGAGIDHFVDCRLHAGGALRFVGVEHGAQVCFTGSLRCRAGPALGEPKSRDVLIRMWLPGWCVMPHGRSQRHQALGHFARSTR